MVCWENASLRRMRGKRGWPCSPCQELAPALVAPLGSQADPAHHQELRARELPESHVKASLVARWIRSRLPIQGTWV